MKSTMKWMLAVCLLISVGSAQAAVPVTDGLVMHLDAGTLIDGSVPVWADQSGLMNDAVQTDAARQPVWVAAAADFANRPVVRFDGVNDFLDLNENMVTVGSFTLFAVGQFDRTGMSGNSFMCDGQGNGSAEGRLRIGWDTAGNRFTMRVGNSANLPAWNPSADTDAHMFVLTSETSGYMDGTYLGTSANTLSVSPGALNLGSYNLGQNQFFKGDIAEVIMFNRVLTATEREQVGIYLSNKYPTIETADRNLPFDPSPADQAIGVLPQAVLTWKAGIDPADLTRVNPDIKTHYVWMSSGNPADPNLTLAATINISNYGDITADSYYAKTPNLGYDKTYYWMIEEGLDNGLGGINPAGDPNNLVSSVWTFQTAGTVPTITGQPVSVKVDADQTAVFTIAYASATSASVTWYKDGAVLTAGGNVSIDTDGDSSTLTITNAASSDEAGYYAVVSNIGGGNSEPSTTVYLRLNQRLAWYQFEQNLNDSEGDNHGVDMFGMQYAAGPVGTDGQVYAADPNGTSYLLLTNDAFPKAGFGNGLDAFTYSCWVKLDPGQGGVILGNLNTGATTGIRFSVNGVENNISTYLRQDGGQSLEVGTGALARDSEWHHVAVTYNGSQMKKYVDGVWKNNSGTNTLTNFVPWEYPMVMTAINGRGTVQQRFSGQIDDLQILNYALTTEQVAQEYLGIVGGWVCDSQQPALQYDFDKNCQVDIGDLAILAAEWLQSNRIYAQ